MEYMIRIDYSTGNSFQTHDTSDYIGIRWKDIDVAKENLKRIQEHYQMYKQLNGYSPKKNCNDILNQNKDKDWFVYEKVCVKIKTNIKIDYKEAETLNRDEWEYQPDRYYSDNCIKLYGDNGETMQMHCFWCGYFESLHAAEIELDKSDLKIEF